MAIFSILVFLLVVLAISDIKKAVACHLFLLPLVNINFLLSDLRFSEMIFFGWERKGLHFDGVSIVLLNGFFLFNWIKRKISFPKEPLVILSFSAYVFFHIVSFAFNYQYKPYVQIWTIFEQSMYLVYLCGVLSLARENQNFRFFIVSFVLGVTASSLLVLLNYFLFFTEIIPDYKDLLVFRSLSGYETHGISVPGPIPHRHFFSAILIVSLLLTFYILINEYKEKMRWIFCLSAQAIAFVSAHSKGAILGLFFSFLFMSLKMRGKYFFFIFVSIFLSMAIVFSSVLLLTSKKMNLSSIYTSIYKSVEYRKYIFMKSLPLIRDDFWTGTGVDSFQEKFMNIEKKSVSSIPQFRQPYGKVRNTSAHNFFLLKLVETGIGGFIAFLLFLSFSIYRLNKSALKLSVSHSFFPYSVISIILGLSIFALTEDLFSYSKVMVLFIFLVVLGLVYSCSSTQNNNEI